MSDVGLPSDVSENDLESPVSLRHGIAEEEGPRSSGALFDADSDVSVPDTVLSEDLPSDVDMVNDAPGPSQLSAPLSLKVPSALEVTGWLQSGEGSGQTFCNGTLQPTSSVEGISYCNILTGVFCFDLLTGWNFDQMAPKDLSLQILQLCTVKYLYCSPPCTMFSALMRLWNQHRMSPEVWNRRWQ